MAKPELEFHKPPGNWAPAFPGNNDIQVQILSSDPESGAHTRLMRFLPGADGSPAGSTTPPTPVSFIPNSGLRAKFVGKRR